MTPRSLMQHLLDLPEELADVDIEFVEDFKEITGDDGEMYGARVDCYVGAIAFNLKKKEVLLMTTETLDKLNAYFKHYD